MADKDIWTAAYLAALAGGHNTQGAEKLADNAVKVFRRRWPS